MSEELQRLLSQVFMNGLIERSWTKAGGDVEKFKKVMETDGEKVGYLFEIGEVKVVDGKPMINWPCIQVRV